MRTPTFILCLFFAVLSAGAAAQAPIHEEPYAEFVPTHIWNETTWCGELRVTSPQQELTNWEVRGTVGTVTQTWGGSYAMIPGNRRNVVFRPAEWNATIPIGGTVAIGVCGTGEMPDNLIVLWDTVTPDPGPARELKITDLTSGDYPFRAVEKQYLVANTAADVKAIEEVIGQRLEVDIDRSTVIGAFMGQRNTGGYSIRVTRAIETDVNIILSVTLRSPGPRCPVTQAITSPYHVVAVEKTTKPVVIDEIEQVYRCN